VSGSAAQDPRGEQALKDEARQAAAEREGERATARDQDEKEIEAAMEAAERKAKPPERSGGCSAPATTSTSSS